MSQAPGSALCAVGCWWHTSDTLQKSSVTAHNLKAITEETAVGPRSFGPALGLGWCDNLLGLSTAPSWL